MNSLCSHLLSSLPRLCGGLIERSLSLWPWHRLKVCVCLVLWVCVCVCVWLIVCKRPGSFVCQSGCWQLCLISGVWIAASRRPAEAMDGVQRERGGETLSGEKEGTRKIKHGRDTDTPERGNGTEKKKIDAEGDEETKKNDTWMLRFQNFRVSFVEEFVIQRFTPSTPTFSSSFTSRM